MFKFYELISHIRLDGFTVISDNKFKIKKEIDVDFYLKAFGFTR